MFNMLTKFEVSTFNRSKDIEDSQNFEWITRPTPRSLRTVLDVVY